MIQVISVLKGYFRRGAKPTESQFGDMIDTIFANNGSQQAEQIRLLQQESERQKLIILDLQADNEALRGNLLTIEIIFQSMEASGLLKRV